MQTLIIGIPDREDDGRLKNLFEGESSALILSIVLRMNIQLPVVIAFALGLRRRG
jgi:hypothetical protein